MTYQWLEYQNSDSKVHAFPASLPYKTVKLMQQAMPRCGRRPRFTGLAARGDGGEKTLATDIQGIRQKPGIYMKKSHSPAHGALLPVCTATVSCFLLLFPIILQSLSFQSRPSSFPSVIRHFWLGTQTN